MNFKCVEMVRNVANGYHNSFHSKRRECQIRADLTDSRSSLATLDQSFIGSIHALECGSSLCCGVLS
jgi:hypothetical protein